MVDTSKREIVVGNEAQFPAHEKLVTFKKPANYSFPEGTGSMVNVIAVDMRTLETTYQTTAYNYKRITDIDTSASFGSIGAIVFVILLYFFFFRTKKPKRVTGSDFHNPAVHGPISVSHVNATADSAWNGPLVPLLFFGILLGIGIILAIMAERI